MAGSKNSIRMLIFGFILVMDISAILWGLQLLFKRIFWYSEVDIFIKNEPVFACMVVLLFSLLLSVLFYNKLGEE